MPQKKKIADKTDKRRRAKVTVGHDADGDPIVKYASGRTQRELDANKEELIRAHVTGDVDGRKDMLFGVYAQEWYEAYKEPHLSAGSKGAYESIMNAHLFPALDDKQLRAITARELQRLLNSKSRMGSSSIGYIKSILTGVFRSAAATGIIDRDPTQGLMRPAAKKKSKRALTDAETTAVLDVGRSHPEGLLLLALYYTGARIGEVLGLQWSDVDFKARTISISRDLDYKAGDIGTVKSASSVRTVPMPDDLSAALGAVRGVGNTFVFQSLYSGSWLPQATYKRRWKRLIIAIAESNLEAERQLKGDRAKYTIEVKTVSYDGADRAASILTAHYFRHNYASTLYNAGVDILSAQRFLGHADVKTTLSIYSHLGANKEDANAELTRTALKNSTKVAERLPE